MTQTTTLKVALTTLILLVAGTSVSLAAVAGPPGNPGGNPPGGNPPGGNNPGGNPPGGNNPGGGGGQNQHSGFALECRVHGDSFYVVNWGNSTVDSGLQIAWASPTTDDRGVALLPKMLAPGQEVLLRQALSSTVAPGAPCTVSIV